MAEPTDRSPLQINAPPEYELKLLTAMATFLGRPVAAQAGAALAMYLRQSHDRVLNQCEYYGHQWGMSKWQVLDLCFHEPEKARALIAEAGTVHRAADGTDVFGAVSE